MNLAIVIPGFQANEQDWCIPAFTNLAAKLVDGCGAEVHVFALRYPHRRESYRVGRVWVHALGGGAFGGRRLFGASLLNLWRDTLRKIRAVHRQLPFDAVVGIWATESGWLATRAARMLDVPSLVHLAGSELAWLPHIRYGTPGSSLPAALMRSTLKNASVVTVPSSPMLKALTGTGLMEPQRVEMWPLGVDTRMFTPKALASSTTRSRPFTFVCVGSLIPVKGHTSLLRGFARLLHNYPECPALLRIVGAGPLERQLRALAARLRLTGYVDFVGEAPHDNLPEIYREADCFVIASWHEAQCMAVLEAMACGLPWIGPPVGALTDLPSLESDAPTGIRVEGREVGCLAEAMYTMMSASPEVSAAWRRNARSIVETEYELSTQTERLTEMLAELTHPSASARINRKRL